MLIETMWFQAVQHNILNNRSETQCHEHAVPVALFHSPSFKKLLYTRPKWPAWHHLRCVTTIPPAYKPDKARFNGYG